ncbi:hypothetical protein L2E82_20577 [Cichorium intybus]|uniref:Uncharacterized protein n=1 Tax=Cichorium intybus TaxID=13427 RepID=A0ACB9DU25_CICIN|nr:hypothetical protein L2E82_20577 [Cichorium intybus]
MGTTTLPGTTRSLVRVPSSSIREDPEGPGLQPVNRMSEGIETHRIGGGLFRLKLLKAIMEEKDEASDLSAPSAHIYFISEHTHLLHIRLVTG